MIAAGSIGAPPDGSAVPVGGGAAALVLVAAALLVFPMRRRRPVRRRTTPLRRGHPRLRRTVIAGCGLFAVGLLLAPDAPEVALALAAIGGALGWILPSRPSAATRREQRWWLGVLLDLWAATVAAGLPAGAALDSVLAVLPQTADQPALQTLRRVVSLLRVGGDADRAWATAADDPELAAVAQAARRSAAAGTDLADALREQARVVRRAEVAQAHRRAARGEVLMAGPLGLCFLPAFICLGLAPVVIALLGTLTIWR